MTHNAALGTQTFRESMVLENGHPPVVNSLPVKASQGTLQPGLIMALDENKELIPYQSETKELGVGDGSTKDFSGTLTLNNLSPGSVTVTDGATATPQTLQDDGSGRLYGDGEGTVNYRNGEVSVSFTAAPANGNPVSVTAVNKPKGVNTGLVDTTAESSALVAVHGSVRRDALLVGANPAAAVDMQRLESLGIYPA